jgi:hypothetical protein
MEMTITRRPPACSGEPLRLCSDTLQRLKRISRQRLHGAPQVKEWACPVDKPIPLLYSVVAEQWRH